jgi:hypothetical protein
MRIKSWIHSNCCFTLLHDCIFTFESQRFLKFRRRGAGTGEVTRDEVESFSKKIHVCMINSCFIYVYIYKEKMERFKREGSDENEFDSKGSTCSIRPITQL